MKWSGEARALREQDQCEAAIGQAEEEGGRFRGFAERPDHPLVEGPGDEPAQPVRKESVRRVRGRRHAANRVRREQSVPEESRLEPREIADVRREAGRGREAWRRPGGVAFREARRAEHLVLEERREALSRCGREESGQSREFTALEVERGPGRLLGGVGKEVPHEDRSRAGKGRVEIRDGRVETERSLRFEAERRDRRERLGQLAKRKGGQGVAASECRGPFRAPVPHDGRRNASHAEERAGLLEIGTEGLDSCAFARRKPGGRVPSGARASPGPGAGRGERERDQGARKGRACHVCRGIIRSRHAIFASRELVLHEMRGALRSGSSSQRLLESGLCRRSLRRLRRGRAFAGLHGRALAHDLALARNDAGAPRRGHRVSRRGRRSTPTRKAPRGKRRDAAALHKGGGGQSDRIVQGARSRRRRHDGEGAWGKEDRPSDGGERGRRRRRLCGGRRDRMSRLHAEGHAEGVQDRV